MHRIDVPTAAPTPPPKQEPGSPGYFTSGDFVGGIKATIPGADWFNTVQAELTNAVEGAGQSLDRNNDGQLLQAIKTLIRGKQIPGQIIVFAGTVAAPGTLICDGAAVSREDYADLFAAIGTVYGEGDGMATFNLPKIGEGCGVIHTVDPDKVGEVSAGEVIAHRHDAQSGEAGTHGHTITIANGGGHAHGASSAAVGDHAHGGWTDGQGNHSHGVGDPGHSHTWNGPNSGGGGGGWSAAGVAPPNNAGTSHNATGIWIGEGGHHAHGVGMNGAGAHGHEIYIAEVGDHMHGATATVEPDHSHAIDVAATGGARNLPAGVRMLYCISY